MKTICCPVLLLMLTCNALAQINTQYPGCTPDGSTAAEVDTRPKEYYPAQKPLSKEALEANEALSK